MRNIGPPIPTAYPPLIKNNFNNHKQSSAINILMRILFDIFKKFNEKIIITKKDDKKFIVLKPS